MKLFKFQITKFKSQINPNEQNSKSQTFGSLELGIWILFVICHLELGVLII
jgi:hypothetical protein